MPVEANTSPVSMSRWALALGKGRAAYAAKDAGAILQLTVGIAALSIVATSGVLFIALITSLAASGKENQKAKQDSSNQLRRLT